MPAFIAAGIGAAGSLFGGLFGASASERASQQYVNALNQAESYLQGQEGEGLQNYQPYLSAGGGATNTLSSLLGTPGKGLLTPWTGQFNLPTAAQAAKTPGFQFQLQQGENAMQNSAAAQGGLLSGRTLASLNNYAQGTASENYQNDVNNAFTQYQSGYNTFLNNQNNTYSRLLGVSGQGLQAAGGAGNLISGIGGDVASLIGGKGAAAAGGTLGQANAYGSIFPGIANSITGGLTLSSLLGNNNSSTLQVPSGGAYNPWSPSLPGITPSSTLPPGIFNNNASLPPYSGGNATLGGLS
jgi:hypothetical protein